jgi:hypothetical protein
MAFDKIRGFDCSYAYAHITGRFQFACSLTGMPLVEVLPQGIRIEVVSGAYLPEQPSCGFFKRKTLIQILYPNLSYRPYTT